MTSITKPIVVVTDGADATPAVSRAIKIACENGTELKLLKVVPFIPKGARSILSPPVLAELRAALQARHEARLQPLVHMVTQAGLSVKTVVREGVPFLEIIREVLAESHDLVLKAADGDGMTGVVFGTADRHLLRKCPCPIWLVTSKGMDRSPRILAAVDPDPSESEQEELSRDVLRIAIEAAQLDSAPLDVLHAWHLFGESLLRGPRTSVTDPEVDQLVGNTLNRRASDMERLLESVPNPGVALQQHLVRDRAADAIASFAEKNNVSLLVMGTVGRAGIPGLLIGNTAERVIDNVRCSILALKPRGFVSPVTLED